MHRKLTRSKTLQNIEGSISLFCYFRQWTEITPLWFWSDKVPLVIMGLKYGMESCRGQFMFRQHDSDIGNRYE